MKSSAGICHTTDCRRPFFLRGALRAPQTLPFKMKNLNKHWCGGVTAWHTSNMSGKFASNIPEMLVGKPALEKTETENCFQIKTSYQRNTATSAPWLQSPTVLAPKPRWSAQLTTTTHILKTSNSFECFIISTSSTEELEKTTESVWEDRFFHPISTWNYCRLSPRNHRSATDTALHTPSCLWCSRCW